MSEAIGRFPAFGATCAVLVSGEGGLGTPASAVAAAEEQLRAGDRALSCSEPGSELSRLNADVRDAVPVSAALARFAAAAIGTARLSGGLVDATLVPQRARPVGAREVAAPVPLRTVLARAPARRPARADPAARWREVSVDRWALTVRRPPGLTLGGGEIAKGLVADQVAAALSTHDSYAIDCSGDLRIGGRARRARPVHVASPFDERVLHSFELREGAVATSGIGRRSGLDADGRPVHHLLDPAAGRPAFTGVVQATALAPSALEAAWRAQAALLAGPEAAASWLPHGGVVVLDDASHRVLAPRDPQSRLAALPLPGSSQARGEQ